MLVLTLCSTIIMPMISLTGLGRFSFLIFFLHFGVVASFTTDNPITILDVVQRFQSLNTFGMHMVGTLGETTGGAINKRQPTASNLAFHCSCQMKIVTVADFLGGKRKHQILYWQSYPHKRSECDWLPLNENIQNT